MESQAKRMQLLSYDFCRGQGLLSSFFVNVHLFRNTDPGYLTLQCLSAWRSYHPLMSRLLLRLSKFRAGFKEWGNHVLNVQHLSWPISTVVWSSLVSTPHLWRHNRPLLASKLPLQAILTYLIDLDYVLAYKTQDQGSKPSTDISNQKVKWKISIWVFSRVCRSKST